MNSVDSLPPCGRVLWTTLLLLVTSTASAGDVDFGRDVLPVLSDRCFQCHGGDATSREADLRLDLRDSAVGRVIVPGDAEASELWKRITSDDVDDIMPPPHAKKRPLSEGERDALRRWIDGGAEYETHWSFVTPAAVAPPDDASGWARTDIDRFVAARLAERGMAPSPPADRASLLRRVFLDLTGLPPTLDEVDAFLSDDRDDAYERVVDRLLSEETYRTRLAERLATPWLDAARYADTIGIHTDNGQQMWAWRDWVLRAFRDDMPYDQFVVEQLAGDLLDDATVDQKVASGFNRNHVITDEGGAINEEYLIEYAIERANTTGAVFLGLTLGCARCHDHKFDPTTQRDYFSFVSFFNSVDQPGLYSQTPDVQQRAFEPFIDVPDAEQSARLDAIAAHIEALTAKLEEPLPREDERRVEFLAELAASTGSNWTTPELIEATSSDPRVTLVLRDDGSLQAAGPEPDFEDYTLTLRSEATDVRMLLLEVLESYDEDGNVITPGGGRAFHGNAVVSHLTLEARPTGSDAAWQTQPLIWAWSDHMQRNRDYEPGNLLVDDKEGWALDGNANAGERTLIVLAEESFGFDEGTDLRVTLAFRSPFAQHSIGRLRVHVSPATDTARLPVMLGRWHSVGPFAQVSTETRYDDVGPGAETELDRGRTFGDAALKWTFRGDDVDGEVNRLGTTVGSTYVTRRIWSPDARELEVAIGSDDGVVLRVNGEVVFEERVDRGAAPAQSTTTLPLRAGHNLVTMQIVNTGGPTAYAFETQPPDAVLQRPLVAALAPANAITDTSRERWKLTWRRSMFDEYRLLDDERTALRSESDTIEESLPRAMVMRELDEPRETFVLMRGAYDQPDRSQPVGRSPPAFLPPLADGARRDRLGLARWMVSDENPLFARVAVNRIWQMLFGIGLVPTSEDFGIQGARPTHPELLDWLAVTFREQGWSTHELLRSIVLSETYRQSSTVRADLAERDPNNRWLHRYPRRRLSAEHIRDLALYTSGLLREQLGGPPVKPYQPAGLWNEVAMTQSNTRTFERGMDDDLWRRSLYTYWKRAVPPPALQTFDAPTRESCVMRRIPTNTPLQALVLWNDEQFVEAARVLAQRTLAEPGSDAERIASLVRRATSRAPTDEEAARIADALVYFRERYADDVASADSLVRVGEAPLDMSTDTTELAAWSMIASTALNLHETLTQR